MCGIGYAMIRGVSLSAVQKAMRTIMKGKTVLAIAHRISTLKEMDRIIVLDKGKIIESGTPQELIKQDGKFAKLYKLQAD